MRIILPICFNMGLHMCCFEPIYIETQNNSSTKFNFFKHDIC